MTATVPMSQKVQIDTRDRYRLPALSYGEGHYFHEEAGPNYSAEASSVANERSVKFPQKILAS